MAAVTETLDTVQSVTQSGYKWGFETTIEMDFAPKGLNEDIIRLISARKEEPEWMLEWRLEGQGGWWRNRNGRGSTIRRSITRICTTTRRRKRRPARKALMRSIPSC